MYSIRHFELINVESPSLARPFLVYWKDPIVFAYVGDNLRTTQNDMTVPYYGIYWENGCVLMLHSAEKRLRSENYFTIS